MLSTIQELGNIVVKKMKKESLLSDACILAEGERENKHSAGVTRAIAVIKQVDEVESTRDGCFCWVSGRTLAKFSPHPGFEGCFAR